MYKPPAYKPCECDRVFQTVGRQSKASHRPGGYWFSHPKAGQCVGDQHVGDGSNCTYRLNEISRAINASCMYETYDEAIESYNPSCFEKCDQPHNTTSTCYLECYSQTTRAATTEQLDAPWGTSFSKCPEVTLPPKASSLGEYLKSFLQ